MNLLNINNRIQTSFSNVETPDLILLNVGFAIHHADWNYKNVSSPFARIYLIHEGTAKVHLLNRTLDLKAGHLYIIPPFTLHTYECDAYFSLFYIHIYENPSSHHSFFESYIFPSELIAGSLDEMSVKKLCEINPEKGLKEYDPSNYDNSPTLMRSISLYSQSPASIILETRGLLYLLCSRFLEKAIIKNEITDGRIIKTIHYIRTHIEKPLSIEELSEICYLSKDHFIRLFKKELQQTPVQYINKKKIERAQLKMITGRQSVKDIAYELAFNNISYFNQLFKKHTGFCPNEYRKIHS